MYMTALAWPIHEPDGTLRPQNNERLLRSDGSWTVSTESGSQYLVDLDRHQLRRYPPIDGVATRIEAVLRRDGLDIPIVAIAVVIGEPMIALLDLYGDGTVTMRTTTPVTTLEAVSAGWRGPE